MNHSPSLPLIGAQIWIEPHHTQEQIDHWMQILADHQMPLTRIWIFWREVESEADRWDFSHYDRVFNSALVQDVRIVATLTPCGGPVHRGYAALIQDDRLPATREEQEQAALYIRETVRHFRNHAALDSWILINEPGWQPKLTPLSLENFRKWLEIRYRKIDALNAAWHSRHASFADVIADVTPPIRDWAHPVPFIDWLAFSRTDLTSQLQDWAATVRAEDPAHPIHVNPHGLVGNLAASADDLPSWRPFLDSLGASIHPSWHFSLLRPDQFPLGVAFVCGLIRGASEPLPFWVTELQGGNNLHSSVRPMCPTPESIAQWLWTGIGCGAERTIFWLLNSREKGYEAGEWSMLDLRNRPTERLEAAGKIARIVREQAAFFASARAVPSPITILLSLETMTLQERYHVGDSPMRNRNAHLTEALALYECLNELGFHPQIKHIDDFAWESTENHLLILPHVTSLTLAQSEKIAAFAKKKTTILATGLTGFYDEEGKVWPLEKFPLSATFGADFKEVRHLGSQASITLDKAKLTLPACDWIAEIENYSAEVLASDNDRVLAVCNASNKGEVFWIPSPIGVGAWIGDRSPLTAFLASLVSELPAAHPFRFKNPSRHITLRVMQSGDAFLTILINGGDSEETVRITPLGTWNSTVLWGNPQMNLPTSWTIAKQGSLALLWSLPEVLRKN